jgi:anaerobic magnesium-protoporphyrin IX monomethyl ester cyclase
MKFMCNIGRNSEKQQTDSTKKKVLLVFMPVSYGDDDYMRERKDIAAPPYGLLSIATYINKYSKRELDVKILDLNCVDGSLNDIDNYLVDTLKEFKADFVGIADLFDVTYPYIERFVNIIKEFDNNIITAVGGAVPSNNYKRLLDEINNLDGVVFLEGEIPLLRVLETDNILQAMENDISWITRKSLLEKRVPKASFVENLDEIPFIDYSLVDYTKYNPGGYNEKYQEKKNSSNIGIHLVIHTSRGCPFNCFFCAAGALHGKKVRYMSVQYAVDNIADMVTKYNATSVAIMDDQFILDTKRAKQILRKLAELKFDIDIFFSSGLTVSYIDDELAYLMHKVGVEMIVLAIEHGSDYMLKEVINKPISLENVRNAVKCLKKYDFFIKSFFVIGLPGETEKYRQETIDFIKEVGLDWSIFSVATPLRGSRLYDYCVENGYIDPNTFMSDTYRIATVKMPGIDPEYITKKVYLMNLEVNFVNNNRMKIKDYKNAAAVFGRIAKKYPFHAFAHYYYAQALIGLKGDEKIILKHQNEYKKIIETVPEWKEYAKIFNLES